MSLHMLPCSLFLDHWKYLSSEQYLSSAFRSKVALSQSSDIGCPTGWGTKRLLSVSFSLIDNIPWCKKKASGSLLYITKEDAWKLSKSSQMIMLAFTAPCSSQRWNDFKLVPRNRLQDHCQISKLLVGSSSLNCLNDYKDRSSFCSSGPHFTFELPFVF